MPRFLLTFVLPLLLALPHAPAQAPKKPADAATPVARIKVLKDFQVELLYSVPKEKEGSWVSMCVDPKGRLIVCDQYGGLFRITPPALGGKAADTKVEPIPAKFVGAQGLLWAFDSLYAVVNSPTFESGLYRIRSSKNNDVLDEVTLLRKLQSRGGEHGPHAVLLTPDGKSLVVVCGNQTALTQFNRTRVPPHWGEDHLLPRMPDGRGFMANVLGPGGAIYQVDPDGKDWELLSVGYRNQYDAAFNRHGDLFTFDADMEWDMNTPWYRPTRVCHVTSGSEFGWRNGTGKWPAYYPDSVPGILDIGPGSPTGVVFGYGAKFPAKYQDAFYICDWSYGKLYAVHLTPDGSSYKAQAEEFVAGTPLPLTDLVVNPKDGALYFAVGGRKTQSGLYRVTYTGKDATAAVKGGQPNPAGEVRRKLEAFHGKKDPKAVETAWPHLNSEDRFLRTAARVAIEHQDVASWRDKALAETKPTASIHALLALVRVTAPDPAHKKDAPAPDPKLRAAVVDALDRLDWTKLTDEQRLEMLRVYQVLFVRHGKPTEAEAKKVIARLNPQYPSKNRLVNADLCQVLVYLEAPGTAAKTVKLLTDAPTQEEQIEYAKSLRMLKTGWTPELRKEYFSWFVKGAGFRGGASFDAFVQNIKNEAVKQLSEAEKVALKPILEMKPAEAPVFTPKPRPLVKKYTVSELTPKIEKGLKDRDYDRGRSLFGQAVCFACHRFANEGGATGPDLTGIAGRFSVKDLLESIVEPNKEISDQYASVIITTMDGKTVTGRIVNAHMDTLHIMTDMLNPGKQTNVDVKKIESMETSKTSLMPTGLLDTLQEDEILDLMAFLLSRGDRKSPMFK